MGCCILFIKQVMISVLISTKSLMEIEDDIELEINQYASIAQLFEQYKRHVNLSEFDHDSSLEFEKLAFEEVAVTWQKQPLAILEKGRRLRDIDKAQKLNIIIYLPSPSEPIIVCQASTTCRIIWNYRNIKPLINTLEGDPAMKKLVNGQILKVSINNKSYSWNDVKNKAMRSLMEGKLGTLIRLKLEIDPKYEEIQGEEQGKFDLASKPLERNYVKPSGEQRPTKKASQANQKGSNPAEDDKKIINNVLDPRQQQIESKNINGINPSIYSKPLIPQAPISNQIKEKQEIQGGKQEIGIVQNHLVSEKQQQALRLAEQMQIQKSPNFDEGEKKEKKKIQNLQKQKFEQKNAEKLPKQQQKKMEQKQGEKVNKAQENKQINLQNSLPTGEIILVIKFQAIYAQSSGRQQLSRKVLRIQSLSELLPSLIKQLKQKGFDWADDSYDVNRDKKKISITFEGNQFHKISKPFKSLINPSTKQITFNITRHYEGG